MRVALVFPPSLCLPNQLYQALPVLAGALREGGHEPQITDLNLLAADYCLDRGRSQDLLRRGRELATRLHREGDVQAGETLARMLAVCEPCVLSGEKHKDTLRDRDGFLDQARFKEAFWSVVDALGTAYQLDPVISPHRENFAEDMIANQEEEPWTIHQELYESGLIEAVLGREPALVGVCVAFPEQAAESVRFARRIRATAPHVKICFGGPLVSQFAEKWLENGWLFDYVDYVCIGDGEKTIVELADVLEGRGRLEDVTNLSWRDASGKVQRPMGPPVLTALHEAPLPDFRSADLARGLTPEPVYPLMASRGCYWGRCTFCSIGWRQNFRVSGNDLLRRDAVDLVETYGARFVQIQDSSLPPTAALQLARIISEEKLGLSWVAGMKFDRRFLDPEYCAELAAGGCRSLLMGIESTSARMVEKMDKGFKAEDVPTMLENIRNAGISAELLWFVGFPGETRTEAMETVRWVHDHRHLYGLSGFVGHYLMHPDTDVAERPSDYGVTVVGQDNDHLLYEVDEGMQMDEAGALSAAMADSNNRTLICNGSHVVHLGSTGLDISGLEREVEFSSAVRHFGGEDPVGEGRDDVAVGRPRFYEEDFGCRSRLERHWLRVLSEWEAAPREMLTTWPSAGVVSSGQWLIMPLFISEHPIDVTLRYFPETRALLESIPGFYAAGISVLAPNTLLPVHTGDLSFILRMHVPLIVPQPAGLRVVDEVRTWNPGQTLAFDDLHPHQAWNFSDSERVVLVIDILRPELQGPRTKELLAEMAYDAQRLTRMFPDFAPYVEREGVSRSGL